MYMDWESLEVFHTWRKVCAAGAWRQTVMKSAQMSKKKSHNWVWTAAESAVCCVCVGECLYLVR